MFIRTVFAGLLALVGTAAAGQMGHQYKIQFQEPFSRFENCLLDLFYAQSPIEFKHVEIAGPIQYGMDRVGNINNYRLVVPLLALTESNHPAFLDLNLIAASSKPWARVHTGGLPIFLTPAVLSPVNVTDHMSGEQAFTVWQDCGLPEEGSSVR